MTQIMAQTMKYNLQDFNNITFDGFNFILPDEAVQLISELSLQVGSPSYIKTPIFQKRLNPLKMGPSGSASFDSSSSNSINFKNKRRGNKGMEVVNDDDWETLRTFHTTKIEQKVGIEAQIDVIRSYLNKMTHKNYNEMLANIIGVIDQLISENISDADMLLVSRAIFDIASTNRFYSKVYADLYAELISKYAVMKQVFKTCFESFLELFNTIEYVDAGVDYDKFCNNNKNNERRKALSVFFVNLMATNGIITKEELLEVITSLMTNLRTFIVQENKKNEVDEITENLVLLCSKKFLDGTEDIKIEGLTIMENIEMLANSKTKTFLSLTNKSIFKFMDMIEM